MRRIAKLGQIAIPSGDQKNIQFWSEYDEMKRLRKEALQDKELERTGRSRARPKRFGKSNLHTSMLYTLQQQHVSSSLKIWKRY